nr:hypothetical protein [Tanacetum cinerariifolium]
MFVYVSDTMYRTIHRPTEIVEQRIKVRSENDISKVYILQVLSYSKKPRPDIPIVTLPDHLGSTGQQGPTYLLRVRCQVNPKDVIMRNKVGTPHTQRNSKPPTAKGSTPCFEAGEQDFTSTPIYF